MELEGMAQQKCLAHLIRNAAKVAEEKHGRARHFSRQLTELLRRALRLSAGSAESLDRLWTYSDEGAALRYLRQSLEPFNKLADMLFRHLEGFLNYCRIKVPLGVVEAVNGNIKALLGQGRG